MDKGYLLLFTCLLGILILLAHCASAQSGRLSNSEESKIEFSVSPNPATDRLTISSPSFQDMSLQIRFFSVTGNLIKQIELENYQKEKDIYVEVSELTRGLYFVEFRSGPHSSIKKVVLR